jgi:hypothetical protein
MTEEQWLACEDPGPMLVFLHDRASDRKLKLFVLAVLRSSRAWLADAPAHAPKVVKQLEAWIEGGNKPRGTAWRREDSKTIQTGAEMAIDVTEWRSAPGGEGNDVPLPLQAALIREIVDNPFRPVSLSPSWLTADVVRMAQGAYDTRAFAELPILADALEDAGCNEAVLSLLRSPGPHVRGCWVVDLVLGKQ